MGHVMGVLLFFSWGFVGLSWCFVGFVTNSFVDFVMRVCWSCHGVFVDFVMGILLVLSWGFCHKDFVGFVMGVVGLS